MVDYTQASDSGGRFSKKHYPEGDYPGQVLSVEETKKKDDKSVTLWLYRIKVNSGIYPYYCNPDATNQAWKIRNLFRSAGFKIPQKRTNTDPNAVVGADIAVSLEDEEYDGKMQSVIGSVITKEELAESNGSAEAPKSGKKSKAAPQEPVEAPQGKPKKGKKGKKSKHSVSDQDLEALEVEDI
jgi:hypothetical protein